MLARIFYIHLISLIFSSCTAWALTDKQRAHEDTLTAIATQRCNSEQIEGQDYTVKVLADGKIGISFLKSAGLKGTFIFDKNYWEGRQKVLQEHQAAESADRRKCIREEVDLLRESYDPPNNEEKNNAENFKKASFVFKNKKFIEDEPYLFCNGKISLTVRKSSGDQCILTISQLFNKRNEIEYTIKKGSPIPASIGEKKFILHFINGEYRQYCLISSYPFKIL